MLRCRCSNNFPHISASRVDNLIKLQLQELRRHIDPAIDDRVKFTVQNILDDFRNKCRRSWSQLTGFHNGCVTAGYRSN